MRTLIIGAGLLALAACGRGGTEVRHDGTEISQDGTGNVAVESADGSARVRRGAPLAGLPEGVPAYPGADTSASVDVTGASPEVRHGRVLTFTTPDSPAQVLGFYARSVAAAGYTIATQATMGPTTMLTAQKTGGKTITVTAAQAGATTQVNIVVASEGA
jgi:hypothetical protein